LTECETNVKKKIQRPCQANAKIVLDFLPWFRYIVYIEREEAMTAVSRISALLKSLLTFIAGNGIIHHQPTKQRKPSMTKEISKNYTDAQEARLAEFSFIDNDTAIELAGEFGKDVRSVRAKAVRLGVYKAQTKTAKTGGKIESKEAIVADIAAIVGKNLDGLEKAPKLVLIELRSKLSA
jgi:hypothetical protein